MQLARTMQFFYSLYTRTYANYVIRERTQRTQFIRLSLDRLQYFFDNTTCILKLVLPTENNFKYESYQGINKINSFIQKTCHIYDGAWKKSTASQRFAVLRFAIFQDPLLDAKI